MTNPNLFALPRRSGFGALGSVLAITSAAQEGHILTFKLSGLNAAPTRVVIRGNNNHEWRSPAEGGYMEAQVLDGGATIQIQNSGPEPVLSTVFDITLTYPDNTTGTAHWPTAAATNAPDFRAFVDNLYRTLWLRAPDAGGWNFYTDRARAEWTASGQAGLDTLRAEFVRLAPSEIAKNGTGGTTATPPATSTGISGFLTMTIPLFGFNIPLWLLLAAAAGGYFMFFTDDKPKRRR